MNVPVFYSQSVSDTFSCFISCKDSLSALQCLGICHKEGDCLALKEKALRRLDEKLRKKGIPYAIGGDWLLFTEGLTDSYHTFDVYVPAEHGQAASAVFERLGMCASRQENQDTLEAEYHFDGADFTFHAGFCAMPDVRICLDDVQNFRHEEIPGASVPVFSLEDAYVIALLCHREQDAALLETHFQAHGVQHPERFLNGAVQPVPEDIQRRIQPWISNTH